MKINKSYLTAIVRKKISVPTQWLLDKGLLGTGSVLDYGCGRGFDADQLGFDKYDPYFSPNKPNKTYDCIVCHYVLNVVDISEEIKIINEVEKLLNPNGVAFFTVRRDSFKEGFTIKNTFQRWSVPELESIYRKTASFEIYQLKKWHSLSDIYK